ncbi:hypothetical protein [Vibrio panuliri]|uniref:hypothetical protein n=1 Tax=Vibrio panuliri TaxID=1381081 RepID=UPI001115476B|nr:hypothetical protein [Vibrio panuliri]
MAVMLLGTIPKPPPFCRNSSATALVPLVHHFNITYNLIFYLETDVHRMIPPGALEPRQWDEGNTKLIGVNNTQIDAPFFLTLP